MHLSQKQLAARLSAAAKQVEVGSRYIHYKQQYYTVVTVALREEDNEPCVIYQAQYGSHITFIRPLTDWLATVEHNGQTLPRFQKVED